MLLLQPKDPLCHAPPLPLNADPLWCEVRGIAGYPTVTFEDVRVVASPFALSHYLRMCGLEDVMSAPKLGGRKRRGSAIIKYVCVLLCWTPVVDEACLTCLPLHVAVVFAFLPMSGVFALSLHCQQVV